MNDFNLFYYFDLWLLEDRNILFSLLEKWYYKITKSGKTKCTLLLHNFMQNPNLGLDFGYLASCKNTSLDNSKIVWVLAILPKTGSEALGNLLSSQTSHFSLTCCISEIVFRANVSTSWKWLRGYTRSHILLVLRRSMCPHVLFLMFKSSNTSIAGWCQSTYGSTIKLETHLSALT